MLDLAPAHIVTKSRGADSLRRGVDEETPVEETMQALDDIVRAGKVRYLGASSMYAWQFAKLQTAAAVHGLTPFVAMENQYNLLKREEEREMIPMCADTGVGLTPYSPNGKGRLSRPSGSGGPAGVGR
ncbi:aldo/keto reductase [Plantibacter flavus]|uniref:aldo/keto reductase n=1 Tax=Plantibacter flavus TaxID=150123 RepID=UPI0033932BBF